MRATRAAAGLLLLALVLGAQAGSKCANCGLGEGDDPCNSVNSAVRAQKLDKPQFFASAEAIKNALKRKSSKPAPSPVYASAEPAPAHGPAAAAYGAAAPAYYTATPLAYNAPPAPSPVSYFSASSAPPPPTPSPPCRSKSFVQTTCRNNTGSYGNGIKHGKDNEDLKNLLSLPPGTSIAPKFEPIGDLCHRCKGYKDGNGNNVIGVIPAQPGKLPCKCPKPKAKAKFSTTSATPAAYPAPAPTPVYPLPAPAASYSAPSASYTGPVSSYTGPASSYSGPAPSYTGPASSYSGPAPSYGASAPSYGGPAALYSATAASAQYAPAYQTPAPHSYSAPAPPPATPATTPAPSPAPAQYAPAYQQSAQLIYVVGGVPPSSDGKAHEKPNAPLDYDKDKREATITPTPTPAQAQYAPPYQQPAQMIYVVGGVPPPTAQSDDDKDMQKVAATPAAYTPTPSEYVVAYQQPARATYKGAPATSAKRPSEESESQPDYQNDEQDPETYVEIKLQKEQEPRYTADPVSISLAYKILADSQGKKHVPEDSLAYGHYKEPADGRISKRVSSFDEEKLHTLDKPVVELKCGKCGNSDCQTLQVSYGDIGYAPVAPSKNRFVPKTDDASTSPYGPAIIFVPPPEDKNSLPCGPLGPTIPGYKPGGVIHGDSNAKPTCGCCGKTAPVQEGSRQVELLGCKCQNNESEEYENGNGKGGIIERVKSAPCNCKQPKY